MNIEAEPSIPEEWKNCTIEGLENKVVSIGMEIQRNASGCILHIGEDGKTIYFREVTNQIAFVNAIVALTLKRLANGESGLDYSYYDKEPSVKDDLKEALERIRARTIRTFITRT